MQFTKSATFTGHRSGIYTLAYGDRPRTFFSSGGDGQVVRWSLDAPDHGELVATVDSAVFALHHDARRSLLLIGKQDGGIHLIDLAERREVRAIVAHRNAVHAFRALGPDRLASCGADGVLNLWRSSAMELERSLPIIDGKLRAMDVARDGGSLAIACGDGTVRVFETRDMNETRTLDAHEGGATCAVWHPSKHVLCSGGKDGQLRLWPEGMTAPLLSFPAHRTSIYAIAFDPSASTCATASRDKTTKLWDARFDPVQRIDRATGGHSHSVNALLWLDGSLITAGDDRMILAWSQNG